MALSWFFACRWKVEPSLHSPLAFIWCHRDSALNLMMLRPEDVDSVLEEFNRYHPSLQFTVDRFQNEVPHFLDLEIHRTGIAIYRKDTHTAQYTHFDSFTRWAHKTAWIRSLVHRAKKLCAPSKLKDEMAKIRTFAAYNGFPRWVVRNIMRSVELTNARSTEVRH